MHESEVKNALDLAGYKLPNHEVREILTTLKSENKIPDGKVSKDLFKEVSDVRKKNGR